MSAQPPLLHSRVALVTGASGVIGAEIALGLARSGAAVALVARRRDGLEATAERLRDEALAPVLVLAADVTSPADVDRVAAEIGRRLGPVAILVNAAGRYGPLAAVTRSDPSRWIQTLMVNVVGPYLTCRAFVPAMVAAGWGRVVNVSSAATLRPPGALGAAYASSKAALNRMTRHLASEVDGTGVTANAIHPGSIRTTMTNDIRAEVAALGDEAAPFREWLAHMDRTGGDFPSGAVELVLELVGKGSEAVNGEFLWARDTLEEPLPGW
jgi:NAD(P)-dependent dehydrogenase (short-subunit alcohol dehydrogenase family)